MPYRILFILLPAAIVWHLIIYKLSPRLGLVKLNFRKQPIMASYGLVSFGYIAASILALRSLGFASREHSVLFFWVMGAMCALGALDDILGTREVGGFKGHFRKLLFERRLTTGAVKALGGGLVGVVAGGFVYHGEPVRWCLAAFVIPLCANLLNLVDLRPGRAVAVLFVGLGVTCMVALGRVTAPWIVGAVALVSLAWGVIDSRGRAMMGDSGSNSLGAALGLTIVLSTGPIAQAVAVVLVAAVHWYSERRSITALIESNAFLRAIDARLGVR